MHLRALLERLEATGKQHEELYDSEVRDAMSVAIVRGFVSPESDDSVPASFGMHSTSADAAIQVALARYIRDASPIALRRGLDEAGRLRAFQDEDVHTDGERQYDDDFFGSIRHDP